MPNFYGIYRLYAVATVFVLAAFGFGFFLGDMNSGDDTQVYGIINQESDPLNLTASTEVVDFAPFWRVWNTLNNKFVPRSTSTDAVISAQAKVWEAIEGLVAAYDDPYTVFLPPEETEDFKESTTGAFEGIGAVIGLDEEERLVVIAPLEDSPAAQAGLLAGDLIAGIDGEDTGGMSTDIAVSKIRGEAGSEVVLRIVRVGMEGSTDIPVTRGNIDIPSTATAVVSKEVEVVKASDTPDPETVKDQGATVIDAVTGEEVPAPQPEPEIEKVVQDFFVLRLFSFSESSMRAFKKGLEEFKDAETNKLIIDLRGNPGGFLEAAVDIGSYFLPKDTLIVQEIVGAELNERKHFSRGHDLLTDRLEDLELVILIDRGSASASEILAGALSEHGVATLIGEKSFGKGSVQELVDITGNVSLKVTIARWFTPFGMSISEQGLEPDIVIPQEELTPFEDVYINKAVDFLTNGTSTEPVTIEE